MTDTTANIKTQAAEWLVKLSAEDVAPSREDYAEFEVWKNADPRHAQAVRKMERIIGRLQVLPAKPTAAALEKVAQTDDRSWASLAKTLCLLAVLLLPLWILVSSQAQQQLMLADQRTGNGEWQSQILNDASRVQLSANSAINVNFSQQQRGIELVQGEIFVDVASDAARPFVVTTPQGRFTALGTRFTVQRQPHASVLTVTESRVLAEVGKRHGDENSVELHNTQAYLPSAVLHAGQRITLYDDGRMSAIETLDAASYEQAWRAHQLVVEGVPLPEVLAQLSPYVRGYLRYNTEELSQIRVYAVLPLDDPERSLQLLSESFPIRVNRFTPWWVSVSSEG